MYCWRHEAAPKIEKVTLNAVKLTAIFSKRRKIGASWHDSCADQTHMTKAYYRNVGRPRRVPTRHKAIMIFAAINISSKIINWNKNKNANSTLRASRAVPHPSTDRAFRRLTSEFGWDRVCSTKYGRWRMLTAELHQQLATPFFPHGYTIIIVYPWLPCDNLYFE